MFVKGEDNVVADALSRINAIHMPSTLSVETIQAEQQQDDELKDLIQKSSLQLQRIAIELDMKIYCDIFTGYVRPYIPAPLRKVAINSVMDCPTPAPATHLVFSKKNSSGQRSNETHSNGPGNVRPANALKYSGITVFHPRTLTSLTADNRSLLKVASSGSAKKHHRRDSCHCSDLSVDHSLWHTNHYHKRSRRPI